MIWSFSPAGATTDECHCPGEVAFTQIVQDAWFNVKHNQTWQLSTVGGENEKESPRFIFELFNKWYTSTLFAKHVFCPKTRNHLLVQIQRFCIS